MFEWLGRMEEDKKASWGGQVKGGLLGLSRGDLPGNLLNRLQQHEKSFRDYWHYKTELSKASVGELYFTTYDNLNKLGDTADRKCLVILLIGNFSGPCPECNIIRIMFLASTQYQMQKQRKEAAFEHHQRFIYEKLRFSPQKYIDKCTFHFCLGVCLLVLKWHR